MLLACPRERARQQAVGRILQVTHQLAMEPRRLIGEVIRQVAQRPGQDWGISNSTDDSLHALAILLLGHNSPVNRRSTVGRKARGVHIVGGAAVRTSAEKGDCRGKPTQTEPACRSRARSLESSARCWQKARVCFAHGKIMDGFARDHARGAVRSLPRAARVAAGALALLTALFPACRRQGASQNAEAARALPAPITVATAEIADVPIAIGVVGRAESVNTVTITPRVSGQVDDVHFMDGQYVEAGTLLYTIDQRPFQAAVDQAKATLARDKALAAEAAKKAAV